MMRILARWDAELSARGVLASQAGLLAGIIALALLGLFYPTLGMVLAGSLFAATALLFPRLGLALLVLVAPIQGLWGLSRQDMPLLLGVLMAAINLRQLCDWASLRDLFRTRQLPLLLVALAIFIAWYLLRGLLALPDMSQEQLRYAAREVTFLILLLGAALAVFRHCAAGNDRALRLGLIGSVALALALTLCFDIVAVYFPALSRELALLPQWQGLRLAGLHINPNATAKFLIAGTSFALVTLWRLGGLDGQPSPSGAKRWLLPALAMAAACAVALGATMSKASLLGVVAALLVVAAAFWRTWRRATLTSAFSAIALLGLTLGFDLVLANGLAKQTLERRSEAEQIARSPASAVKLSPQTDLMTNLGNQLRIGHSSEMVIVEPGKDVRPVRHSEMYRNIEGTIEYRDRECSGLTCTGQRDRLWKTGLQVWSEHWLIGIGPGAWPGEYLQRERFPFDTPHNVVLELGGGFGLVGLAIYGLLVFGLLRAVLRVFAPLPGGTIETIYARGVLMFALALLATEWFDPVKFFAMSPHGLWLWLLLAGVATKPCGTLPQA